MFTFFAWDNFLANPDEYVSNALSKPFSDMVFGQKTFKNIQMLEGNEVTSQLLEVFPDHCVTFNFIRKSPLNQIEPHTIHHDCAEGDITAILYLNKVHPKDGTILYNNDLTPAIQFFMKYNRMIIFPSEILHSRAKAENFGKGDSSRLIHVTFLRRM